RARARRVRHVELVYLQDVLALPVVVLQQSRLKQQLLHLDDRISQEELSVMAHRLNQAYTGSTAHEIGQQMLALTPFEERVTRSVTRIMETEGANAAAAAQLSRLRGRLAPP